MIHVGHSISVAFMTVSADITAGGTRTTVHLSPEVLAAARKLQEQKGVSLSAAVDELALAGLERARPRRKFVLPEYDYEPKVDVTNVGDVLGIEEEEEWLGHDDR